VGISAADAGAKARILILEPAGENEGGAFVSAYDAAGGFIGDTWYPTREEALLSALTDNRDLGEWRPVPANAADPEAYALLSATGGLVQ